MGFRVQSSEFRVQGSGFRVQGSGLSIWLGLVESDNAEYNRDDPSLLPLTSNPNPKLHSTLIEAPLPPAPRSVKLKIVLLIKSY